MSARALHGLLLTGGASTRMGRDKATLVLEGRTLAKRVAGALNAVAHPVLAVGPSAGSGLEAVGDPGQGPLTAIASGRRALLERGADGPAIVAACDLPFADPALLSLLAAELGDSSVAVPVAGGRDQPLCACYAPRALDLAGDLGAAGVRSMKEFLASLDGVRRIDEAAWRAVAAPRALTDVDTQEEWSAIGSESSTFE